MADNSIFIRLIAFILIKIILLTGICSATCGVDVLCPGVKVETSPPPAKNLPSYPPELLYAFQRIPYFPPLPYYPPPVQPAPSYCVQSVVVSGSDDFKKNKTSVLQEKGKQSTSAAFHGSCAHTSAVSAQLCSPHHTLSNPAYAPFSSSHKSTFDHHKCELYLEKLLRMLKEKSDTSGEVSIRHKLPTRKKLRKKKKKYHFDSIEEDYSPTDIVKRNCQSEEEDEEDGHPIFVIKRRRRRRRIRPSRAAFLQEDG